MAANIRRHPLEIPPPSEKDWPKDDEEDFFLQDPDRKCDALPQPFRMINKVVMQVFESAMEIIERREMLREAQKRKVQSTKCSPTAEFQVTGRANCLAVSGKYLFVGVSVGLAAFSTCDCKEICAWDAVKTEICALHASDLGNESHVLLAVDEMGLVWLFCFHKESFLLIKALNEVGDISKRSTCVEVVLSPGGDYAGVLLQESTKAWLEIYQLPKDSWLREMEEKSEAAAGLACSERRPSCTSAETQELHGDSSAEMDFPVSANQGDPKLDLPVLLLTVKPPEPITGSSFESPLDALKEVDDGSMLGLGYKHLIKDFQWELQEAIFRSTYREYLEAEGVIKEEVPRHATFHFLLPSQVLQVGPDMEVQPDVPAGIGVHWGGNHNFCLYLLSHPLNEQVDPDLKPDVVWPCAAPIACSAVSSCSRYLALAGEDATITIWDKHLGFPLSVTAILEERFIRSIHFLRSSAAASDDTLCPGTDPVCLIVQLLVLCTDSSYYLVKAPRAGKSSITLLADRPEDPNLTVSAVVPILAFPSAVLIFFWDGTVSLMNTDTSQTVYCFSTPPSHAVASPWQPVFTVDSVNSCLLLRGDEQQQDNELAQSKASHSTIFLFDFNPLKEAFPKEPDLPLKSSQNLPWFERCNVFLRDRQQSPLGLEEPKYWSRLKARAAAMDKEKQKVKGQKKQ
ncbi:WD repeat-containing protein 93 [Corapipo altera]|uniref:WD repeat-containing protein 93 n=1 Tax=Corapipo altera TaxID=415028 RepID=UPI000FD64381|nr:WD repeat-containing protein 93 [Corapipo altera]XP_027500340.1 WD repeat-containing protein 93 [Corapipo altera]XP_027500341.1 WD repeat-containing protein 93 [Corapipo altera]